MDSDRALESFQMVDLEASMKKLLSATDLHYQISSSVSSTSSSASASATSAAPFVSSSSSAVSTSSSSVYSLSASDSAEDVDGFLREALQGKDRLTSKSFNI